MKSLFVVIGLLLHLGAANASTKLSATGKVPFRGQILDFSYQLNGPTTLGHMTCQLFGPLTFVTIGACGVSEPTTFLTIMMMDEITMDRAIADSSSLSDPSEGQLTLREWLQKKSLETGNGFVRMAGMSIDTSECTATTNALVVASEMPDPATDTGELIQANCIELSVTE